MKTKDSHLNILVIEDNPADFFLIEEMLNSSPIKINKVLSSIRVGDACSILQSAKLDLVLLDLSLPDSSGIDSFLRIKPFVQNIPVIILSGQTESTIAIEALKQGAQDYLVKGEFKIDLLTKAINYSIERKNEQQVKQRQITEAVLNAQEKERKGISEELHDNINQILATSKLFLNTALHQKELDRDLVLKSEEYISMAMEEIRKLSKALNIPVFIQSGLKECIKELVDNILIAKSINISVDLEDLKGRELSPVMNVTIYRIIQEHLNNILKHAEATFIEIRLSVKGENITLSISDNGVGFDTKLRRTGIGITNINSRAELFNGKVEVDSSPGHGCRLTVELSTKTIMPQMAA